jgi:Resolvase, N terminal domain
MLVGYARCSTDAQDLTAQRDALTALGVTPNRIYVDHGLTGTNRARPGLSEALAACRFGDTLVVTKLDRLARSLTMPATPRRERTVAGRPSRSTVRDQIRSAAKGTPNGATEAMRLAFSV